MLTRRNIIFAGLGGIAISAVGIRILQNSGWLDSLLEKNVIIAGGPLGIYWIDLVKKKIETVASDIGPHSFLIHPKFDRKVFVIEKRDDRIALIDFDQKKVERYIHAPSGHWFYGHGLISKNNNSFLVTRVNESTGIGVIAEYDLDNYQEIRTISVADCGLHDLFYFSDQRRIAVTISGVRSVTNSGIQQYATGKSMQSSVAIIDELSGQILMNKAIDVEEDVITHMARGPEDSIIAVTTPLIDGLYNNLEKGKGSVYFASIDSEFEKLDLPESLLNKLKGENLSIQYYQPTEEVVVTNPASGTVFMVNVKNRQVTQVFDVKANGAAFSKNQKKLFLSSQSAAGDQLTSINLSDYQLGSELFNTDQLNLYSSHILLI